MTAEPSIEITVQYKPSGAVDTVPWLASAELPSGYACCWGRTKSGALADLCDKIRVANNPAPAETFYATPDGDLLLPASLPELHSVRVPVPENAA